MELIRAAIFSLLITFGNITCFFGLGISQMNFSLPKETSAGFTESLMQRISVASAAGAYTRSVWQDKLFKIIGSTFIFISIFLLLFNIPLEKFTLSFDWKLELPSALSFQMIQFLIVFWIVMIVNRVLSAKKQKEV